MKSAIKNSLLSPTRSNLSSSFLKKGKHQTPPSFTKISPLDLSVSASIMNPSPSAIRSPPSSSLLSAPSSFAPSLLPPSNSSFHSDFERKVKESRKKEIIDRINNLTLKLSPKKEKFCEHEPKAAAVHASIFGSMHENLREEANRSFVETGKKAFIEAEVFSFYICLRM